MTSSGYLRYPHIHGDLVVFVAEDDIWLAPAGGGRAWKLSADSAQVSYPRFSRDGTAIRDYIALLETEAQAESAA